MLFISSQKLFSFSRYLSFCHDFWSFWKNGLIRKILNFKIHDVTTWLTNNCNTYIAQYLTKLRQPDNETFAINRINERNIFLYTLEGRLVQYQTSLFFKKAYHEVKANCLQLSFNIISIALNLAYNENKLYKTLRLLIQRYAQF